MDLLAAFLLASAALSGAEPADRPAFSVPPPTALARDSGFPAAFAPRAAAVTSDAGRRRDRFFAEDKLLHFFTSFAATSLAASGARAAGFEHRASVRIGVATGVGVGIGKEIYDLTRPHETASVLDLVWDFAGVGAAAAVATRTR